jgi:rhodanese-related sulfurtransferase
MFSRFSDGSNADVVSVGDLEEAAATNAWAIVDVRERHEFAADHIPNALNMPMSSFDPKELPEGKPVVLEQSRDALSKAKAIGREYVRRLGGGMNAWRMDARVSRSRTVETFGLKLELDQRESRAVADCLLARRSRLIETIGDTTETTASRSNGSRELELVESVLRKLRLSDHAHN